jgi:hypothetical protein
MTREQELKARELLNRRFGITTPTPDANAAAKSQHEAQKKLEAEARALEAQRKAEKNQAQTLAPIPGTGALPATDSDQAHQQALKNAEAEAKAQLQNLSKAPPQAAPPAQNKKPSKSKGKVIEQPKAALEPIPVPISQSKQQRLMILLEAYKRDQLTPAQYHQERAKILAEP